MMTWPRSKFFSLGLFWATASCQDATSARLSLRTNIEHTPKTQVALWVSNGAVTPDATPQTVITDAWDERGQLGDLVVVPPSVGAEDQVTVNAVLAQNGDAGACLRTLSPQCVLSRRTFRYRSRTQLTIPLGLYRECLGVTCGDGTTCNYQGRCVSQELDTRACPTDGGCILEGDPVQAPGITPLVPPTPKTPDVVQPADVPAPAELSFRDQNPAPGWIRGRLRLRRATDETRVDGYRLFWATAEGKLLALAKEWPAQARDFQWDLLPDVPAPTGAALLAAVSVRGAASSMPVTVRADTYPRSSPLELDTGADSLLFGRSFLTTEGAAPSFLLVALDSSNRVTTRRCSSDGSQCKRSDISPPGFGAPLTRFGATVTGGRVYVAQITAEQQIVMHICTENIDACTTRDMTLGEPATQLYAMTLQTDVDRGEIHALSVEAFAQEPSFRMVHRRCLLDGTKCIRRDLDIPLGDASFGVEPMSGDIVIVAAAYGPRGQLLHHRCARSGTPCMTTALEGEPREDRCLLESAMDPATGTLYTVVARACGVQGGPAPLLLRCAAGSSSCEVLPLPGVGDHFGRVSIAFDAARNRILMGASDLILPGNTILKLYTCGAPLGPCTERRVGLADNEADPHLVADKVSGAVYLASRATIQGNTATLTRCNASGESCVRSLLADSESKRSFANNGFTPSIAFAPDGTLGLGATYLRSAIGYKCGANGGACQKAFTKGAEEANVSYWSERSSFVFAARTYPPSPPRARPSLGIGVCGVNASTCSIEDASAGYGEGGYLPQVLPDSNGQSVHVMHLGLQNGFLEPVWTSCDANALNCAHRRLGIESGLPAKPFTGADAKLAAGGDAVHVSGVSGGRIRLMRCATRASGCAAWDLGPAPVVRREVFPGTALLETATGVDVLVGEAEGIVLHRCTGNGQCTQRPLPVRRHRGNAPDWLSVVRDPANDAVYVAAFRDGVSQELFLDREDNYGTLVLFRCSADFSICHEVLARADVFSVTVHDGILRSDGGSYFWGTPVSLVHDAARRRIVLAVTDAADLLRPLVLELDTY
jgi:hypothetical protein